MGLGFSDFRNADIIVGYINILIILIQSLINEGKQLKVIQG